MHVKVSEDFLQKIASMPYDLPLRTRQGDLEIVRILEILGFVLRDGKIDYHVTATLVRNPKRPYQIREMLVYEGEVRDDYPYIDMYTGQDILVGDFTYGKPMKNIEEVEEFTSKNVAYYNRGKYVPVEYTDHHADNVNHPADY